MSSKDDISIPLLPSLPAYNRTASAMKAIEQYISTQKLSAGDPLPSENQLCQELQISRSAVREAISKLQALDIVEVQRGKGTFVGEMSLEPLTRMLLLRSSLDPASTSTLHEVVQVRKTIDLGAAPVIVEAMSGTYHKELHELVDHMINAAAAGQPIMDDDIKFHAILFAKGPKLLSELVDVMWTIHMTTLAALEIKMVNLGDTLNAHVRMLEAAEAGDLPAYIAAVDDHYQPLLNVLAGRSGAGV